MKVIGVPCIKNRSEDHTAIECLEVLNGIAKWISIAGWAKGYRNNMAVDFCLAYAYIIQDIDMDSESGDVLYDALNQMVVEVLDKGFVGDNAEERVYIIADYISSWLCNPDLYFVAKPDWLNRYKHNPDFKLFEFDIQDEEDN